MDGIGIRPVLQQIAGRIAAAGYYMLLPNMFYRRGRAPIFDVATILNPENRPALMEIVSSLTQELVVRDAGTFLAVLAEQKEGRPGSKVGITGYCMGGAMVCAPRRTIRIGLLLAPAFTAGGWSRRILTARIAWLGRFGADSISRMPTRTSR